MRSLMSYEASSKQQHNPVAQPPVEKPSVSLDVVKPVLNSSTFSSLTLLILGILGWWPRI